MGWTGRTYYFIFPESLFLFISQFAHMMVTSVNEIHMLLFLALMMSLSLLGERHLVKTHSVLSFLLALPNIVAC